MDYETKGTLSYWHKIRENDIWTTRKKHLALRLDVSPYVHHMFVSVGMTRDHFMMMISQVDVSLQTLHSSSFLTMPTRTWTLQE